MSQKQFEQANMAAAAGSDIAAARTASSQKQSNQANLAATLPQEIIGPIQTALAQRATAFAQGLAITTAPVSPFAPNQELTAGLNKSTTGLNLDLTTILTPILLTTLRTLVGDPNFSLLPINVSIAWTISGGVTGVPTPNQVQVVGTNTAPTFELAFKPQIKEKTQGNPDFSPFNIGVGLNFSVQLLNQTITAPPINVGLPVQIPTLLLSAIIDAVKAALATASTGFAKGLSIKLPPVPISISQPVAIIPPIAGKPQPVPVAPDQKLTAALSKSTTGLSLNLVNTLSDLILDGLRSLTGNPNLSSLPINVAITWTVSGGQLSGRLLQQQEQVRVQGANIAPTFVLAFLPQLIERTKTNPQSVQFTISVKLTLSVQVLDQTVAVPPINLSVPIQLPTLPIPTLLGLFRHVSFAVKEGNKQGFLLLVVPADSPFNVTGSAAPQLIQDELADLKQVGITLSRVLGVVSTITGFVLPSGLNKLVDAIATISGFGLNGINVTTNTQIPNLNKITMIDNPFLFKFNDIEAQNEISSLIMIGGASANTKLFRRKDFETKGGQLNISPSAALVTLISNLHREKPVASPDSAKATVPNPNDLDIELWSNKHFGDSISSLKVTFP